MTFPYRYAWSNNSKRAGYFGRLCRVVCRAIAANSVMLEFEDGERTVTSRYAIRKVRG